MLDISVFEHLTIEVKIWKFNIQCEKRDSSVKLWIKIDQVINPLSNKVLLNSISVMAVSQATWLSSKL